jgi:hypothetical protein
MDVIEQLAFFCREVEFLNARRFVRDGRPERKLSIEGQRGIGGSVSKTPVDEDDLRSWLLALRKFWLQEDICNIKIIQTLAVRHLVVEDDRKMLIFGARSLKETLRSRDLIPNFKGKHLTRRELIDLYFNAKLFHNDLEDLEMFERLFPMPMFDFMFETATLDFHGNVTATGQLIRHALDRGDISPTPVLGA